MVPLLLMLSAAGSTNLGELVLTPTPHCQAVMDMWCGTLTQCVLEVKTTGGLLPLVARFGLEGAHEWRCYSPSALDKNGTRYTGGPQFCSEDALLRQVLGICNGSLPQQPYPVPAEGGLPPHSSSSSDCDPSPTPQSTVIMAAGQDSTACFRITSVVGPFGTDSPSVLVFAEARENSCADAGSYALALVRSEDGSTWPTGPGSVQYLFNDTAAAKLKSDGINLGASVYDAKRKTVHVLFDQCADQFGKAPCGETASLLVMSSRDFGKTWYPVVNITNAMIKGGYAMLNPGPGTGIQTATGRLLVPAWGPQIQAPGAKPCVGGCDRLIASMIYSDNGGVTWEFSAPVPNPSQRGANELQAAQLPNGTIVLNVRVSIIDALAAFYTRVCSHPNNEQLNSDISAGCFTGAR